MKKSTLLHLRIPFSFYLMPFFIFALSQAKSPDWLNLILSFIAIHLFFYPSSNAFNSYFDRDKESIGGLKNPPPVEGELLLVSLLFFAIALSIAVYISYDFFIMMFIIGLASKAYSHPVTRLKKYPVVGLLVVSFFQGAFIYCMSLIAIDNLSVSDLFSIDIILPASLCSVILLGSYPMTQVYQHSEDSIRGDLTFSRLLGIRGTFLWTIMVFTFGIGGMVFFLTVSYSILIALLLPVFLTPTLIFFVIWYINVIRAENKANFDSTMKLNKLSSTCFICFFLFLFILKWLKFLPMTLGY